MKVKINNKNLRMILIVAAVTVVALGVLLLLISGNEDRNKIPNDPTEASETTESETAASLEETTATPTEEGVGKDAQILFNAKVERTGDSVAIARLLETIDLKKNVANYRVEIQSKKSPKSITITFDKTVATKERKAFDDNVQKYAEQILALVTDLDEVQWVYAEKKTDNKKEDVTVYLNTDGAETILKTNVKKYGESAKAVQTLLDQQKGL